MGFTIFNIIRNKKIRIICEIIIIFIIIIFCIAGTFYGQIPHKRIHKIAENIMIYKNDNIGIEEIKNKLNLPKNMEIIEETGEIIIFYKDFIYLVNAGRYLDRDYFMRIIKENEVIINNDKDLVYYVLREGYLDVNK